SALMPATPLKPVPEPAAPAAGAAAAVPGEICGYPVDSALPSTLAAEPDFLGPSFLAIGPGGRGIVLKPLDRDCLYKGGLHPSIKERLARVRELALAGVANLYGVERDPAPPGGRPKADKAAAEPAWLIWEYARGRPLHEYAADAACTPRKLALAARELVLGVEALHRQGIVHGAIRPSNVIVDAHGAVRLTHVSPLLYTDPADDVWGVINTLEEVLKLRDEQATPLGQVVGEVDRMLAPESGPAPGSEPVLRMLATRLSAVVEARDRAELAARPGAEPDVVPARRSLVGALVVTLLGAALAAGIWHAIRRPDIPWGQWVQSVRDQFR
ncbi:MAG TPA: hypothetical protein VF796_19260, partial [Humisphaera sp.]